MEDLDKKYVVDKVREGFDALLQYLHLDDMIDDMPSDILNDKQKKWAKENIEWDLKVNKV